MNPSSSEVELSDRELDSVFGGLSRAWLGAWDGPEAGESVPTEAELPSTPEA
jgi:hypothetical protein